jgi:hypothetical protein
MGDGIVFIPALIPCLLPQEKETRSTALRRITRIGIRTVHLQATWETRLCMLFGPRVVRDRPRSQPAGPRAVPGSQRATRPNDSNSSAPHSASPPAADGGPSAVRKVSRRRRWPYSHSLESTWISRRARLPHEESPRIGMTQGMLFGPRVVRGRPRSQPAGPRAVPGSQRATRQSDSNSSAPHSASPPAADGGPSAVRKVSRRRR